MAYAVSDDGLLVVGRSSTGCWRDASTWSSERGWTPLDACVELESAATAVSRDGRWAVGFLRSLVDAPRQAVRWSLQGGEKRVAARASYAAGVSDQGTVVGYFEHEDPSQGRLVNEAMSWAGDEPARFIGDLPGGRLESRAHAILRDGTWIAGCGTTDVGEEAVLWDEQRRLHRVKDLLDASGTPVPPGWTLSLTADITRNGNLITICGDGLNPAGQQQAWVARFRIARSIPPSAAPDAR